jgi:transcriptional regulator with XRE-family HTH domain
VTELPELFKQKNEKTAAKNSYDKKSTGKRIKSLRTAKNMSMSELAKDAGVSKSLISQVERGEVYPSLLTLEKIADSLGVHLSRFFQIENPAANFNDCIVRKGKQKIILMPLTNNRYHVLTANLHDSAFEFLLIEYPPFSGGQTGDQFVHNGKECFYMLEGELTLKLGEDSYYLSQGDSGSFDSSIVHIFLNHSNKTSKIIIAATNPAM